VGFDKGLFSKHGIDLKMAYIQGNRVMLSALTAGEIQLYQGGAEGLIRLCPAAVTVSLWGLSIISSGIMC
jgi:ABC-type nitrate/sulfonate/bicarbonate transport system substrate-binding protein